MNDNDLLRYSRQIMLPEIDIAGQEQLLDATVLIIGLGGLGCPVAMYLAAAGVGHLILADFDAVELSNLQRQIAHKTSSIGQSKVTSAAATINELNPDTKVTCFTERLDQSNLTEQIRQADLVVDCTDNFDIRFSINSSCVAQKTSLVSGSAIRLEGQVMVFDANASESACYACLYQTTQGGNSSCSENGVAAPVVGVIGSIQAVEAIKLIVGFGESLAGYLLVFDAKTMDFRKLKLSKNPNCSVCG